MAQCGLWKLRKFILTHFCQKFRESNGFTKEITKELIWRNIFLVRLNFSFFHTVHCRQKQEIYKKIREINSLVTNIHVTFTKFYQVSVTQCGNFGNIPPLEKIFVKSIYSISLVIKLLWRNFCKKVVGEKFSNFHSVRAQCGKTWNSLPCNFYSSN